MDNVNVVSVRLLHILYLFFPQPILDSHQRLYSVFVDLKADVGYNMVSPRVSHI